MKKVTRNISFDYSLFVLLISMFGYFVHSLSFYSEHFGLLFYERHLVCYFGHEISSKRAHFRQTIQIHCRQFKTRPKLPQCTITQTRQYVQSDCVFVWMTQSELHHCKMTIFVFLHRGTHTHNISCVVALNRFLMHMRKLDLALFILAFIVVRFITVESTLSCPFQFPCDIYGIAQLFWIDSCQ